MGKIVLLRHGEVDIKDYKRVSAKEFGEWILRYDSADIISKFPSKAKIESLFNSSDILVCSSLKRSLCSVKIFNKTPSEVNSLFNEAQVPYNNWSLLKLNPKVWLLFFRVLWFLGYCKYSESYKESKHRAKRAAKRLVELSKEDKTVVLIGHGIMNRLIQKELILSNWKESKKSKSSNWDYGVFKR